MNKTNLSFTREDTRAIKGVAVVMMLLHHLAGFTDRFPVGFEGFTANNDWFVKEGFLLNLAHNLRFCVGIFYFLGGYGIYKRMEKGSFSLTDSVLGMFKKYWKIFIIFVPVAFIFFSRSGGGVSMLASRYNFVNVRELITTIVSNFTMLSDTINSEWWFMKTYICVFIMGTAYCRITKKLNSFSSELLIAIILDMLFRSVLPNLPLVPGMSGLSENVFFKRFCIETATASPFFAGIVFAKYDVLVRLKKIIGERKLGALFGLFAAAVIVWCRCFIVGAELDLIYVPIMAAALSVFFDFAKPFRFVFNIIGGQSTNMWLIHSFYCYYFLEITKIVYITSNVWIDLLILVSMSLLTSVLIELFYKYLFKGTAYIRNKCNKLKTA